MKKVGQTSAGSVLVEMTRAQYTAMTKLLEPARSAEPEEVKSASTETPTAEATMFLRSRMESIRTCLGKMKPQTKKELVRAIRFVCRHSGGVRDREIEQIIKILEREDFLSLADGGRVAYVSAPEEVEAAPVEDSGAKPQNALLVEEAGLV